MPSHARTSAPAHAGQDSQPHARTDQGTWSSRLAASPRQLRQAGQLRSLFGERAAVPGRGVVQGAFVDPDGDRIETEEDAHDLADAVIEEHEGYTGETITRRQRRTFEKSLASLATDGADHGTLDHAYLQDLLERGAVREEFDIRQEGRRLHTSLTTTPNFPPRRSATAERLKELAEKKKNKKPAAKRKRAVSGLDSDEEKQDLPTEEEAQGDFSYRDLRAILDKAGLAGMPAARLEAATRQAVQDFEAMSLGFSGQHSVDVQLVVQHLLQYHLFNSPQLTGRARKNMNRENAKQKEARLKREVENASRQHELDKSGRLLETDASNRFEFTMPPDPTRNDQAHYAFSALQDVNRPLPDSALEGATYKAVYLCVKKVLHESWRIARTKKPRAQGKDLDKQQRLHFNRVLVDLLPTFEKSTVAQDKGVDYVRDTLGFSRFSAREELSDEDSSSSEEEDELDAQQERGIFDVNATVEANEPKIKTWTAATGTFVKLALQKRLIDTATLPARSRPGAISKHAHRMRKINRHVRRVSEKHQKNFRLVNSELNYLKRKRELLEKKIKASKGVKLKRAQKLLNDLNGFYGRTSVSRLSALASENRQWKRNQPAFKFLGPKALDTYLAANDKSQ